MPIESHRGGSRAQATPLLAVVLVLAALLLVPVALVARATIERAEAQSAADAVALAGALASDGNGESEARAVARRNDARVHSYAEVGDAVEVVVIVGGRRATARAVREIIRTEAYYPSAAK